MQTNMMPGRHMQVGQCLQNMDVITYQSFSVFILITQISNCFLLNDFLKLDYNIGTYFHTWVWFTIGIVLYIIFIVVFISIHIMVCSCSVHLCTNRSKPGPRKIHFFSFPLKNAERTQQWVNAVGRKGFIPTKYSKVCSDHFHQNDFEKICGGSYLLK